MYMFKHKANVEQIIDEAALRAEYTPTIFKIYDKSTSDVCNRLIVVSPFDWYIWACRGELYILNPEGGIKCAANTTPAVQVLADQFLETCLKLNLNSILDAYVNGKIPYTASYEITTTTFTILSALNILMKEYITFDTNNTVINMKSRNNALIARMRHLTDNDMLNENFTNEALDEHNQKSQHRRNKRNVDNVDIEEETNRYRVLSGDDVIRITTARKNNLSELQKHYTKHTSNLKTKHNDIVDFSINDLDPSHDKYITLRQHAKDAHENNPKMVLSKPKIVFDESINR